MVHNRKISQGLFTVQAYLGLIFSGSSQRSGDKSGITVFTKWRMATMPAGIDQKVEIWKNKLLDLCEFFMFFTLNDT